MRRGILYALAFLGALFLFFIVVGMLFSFSSLLKPSGFKEAVGIIEIKGVITEAESKLKTIREFKRRRDIKAVVIRIDSPGGAVGASQELYEEIKSLAERKPVVVSMGSVATSGAYYAALGAKKIMAMPGTITGSIGVILIVPNIEELLKKLGVRPVVLKSGRYKDLISYYRVPGEDEKKVVMETLEEIHRQFMKAVSESRNIPLDKVKEIADGRIFTGEKALKFGLVDAFGTLQDAVEEAAKMAGLGRDYGIVYGKKKRGLIRRLLEDGSFDGLGAFLFAPYYLWEGGLELK